VDVPLQTVSRAGALLVTGYHLLSRFRFGACDEILAAAASTGATIALDLGPAIDRPARLGELAGMLGRLDFVIGNADELVACTGSRTAEEASAALLAGGAQAVVVKRGRLGSELHTADGVVRAPAYAVEDRGTVGAGDAFNAGFLFSIRRGRPPKEALRYGNAVAALVVASPLGIRASPDPGAVESLIEGSS
jgi:sugar/nucleoside kinase (ribokinase family)